MLVPDSYLLMEEAREHRRQLLAQAERERRLESAQLHRIRPARHLRRILGQWLVHAGEMLQTGSGPIHA